MFTFINAKSSILIKNILRSAYIQKGYMLGKVKAQGKEGCFMVEIQQSVFCEELLAAAEKNGVSSLLNGERAEKFFLLT